MAENNQITKLRKCWGDLYGSDAFELLEGFIRELKSIRPENDFHASEQGWYKDAIVYSLYVDLFNKDLPGLAVKLDYLTGLGINCLWLLPILESPMRDAGFDISNYRKIRSTLLGEIIDNENEDQPPFVKFLREAHRRNIRVIFDIALNHTSDQHFWFRQARSSPDNPYRDYYIWNKDADKYRDARLLFKGMCPSNWEKDGEWYYFHRFFEFQPDLNYKNPGVLLEMSRNLIYWLKKGIDGFRADAIPYLWKEDGTNCENLPQTHIIVKFFRAALEYLNSNTLLLAEACQKPAELVKYLETGDECNAGYHFPLMPMMFKSLASKSREPIIKTLDIKTTPEIPSDSQWFTFLRCHDELSLELVYVSEEDRKYIHENYCRKPEWDFRVGEGISARLSELMQRDPRRIGVILSLMLTLPGTPVIYYGDEFGKFNDEDYYQSMIRLTGKDDTRFLVRGRIDWQKLRSVLNDPGSFQSKVFRQVSKQVNIRKQYRCFGRGGIQWLDTKGENNQVINEVAAYIRSYEEEKILVIQNLSGREIQVRKPAGIKGIKPQGEPRTQFSGTWPGTDLLGQATPFDPGSNSLLMPGFSYYWFEI